MSNRALKIKIRFKRTLAVINFVRGLFGKKEILPKWCMTVSEGEKWN